MSKMKAGSKTLLWSIIMSSPGPLVMGLSLISGRSITQIADFIRRTSEFFAIVMSFVTFMLISQDIEENPERRKRLESQSNLFVGCMMCIAGSVMAVLAMTVRPDDKGNVIPSLVIAGLSAVANAIFWRRYTCLKNTQKNAIFTTQVRLYRSKTLIDSGVIIALTSVIINSESIISRILDIGGSVIIALYMILGGICTIRDRNN